jgi:hypothetical protein
LNITEVAYVYFWTMYFLQTVIDMNLFWQKWAGRYFGRFAYKLIWSPWWRGTRGRWPPAKKGPAADLAPLNFLHSFSGQSTIGGNSGMKTKSASEAMAATSAR